MSSQSLASRRAKPKLIDNRPAALIAVALTAYASYATARALLQSEALHGSILLMQFPAGTSASVIAVINILLELVFAAVIIGVAWSVRGWERILICFYSSLVFLSQLTYLLPGAVMVIRCIKVICALVSAVAALVLLVRVQRSLRAHPGDGPGTKPNR